jgi:hypothetical protein
MKGKEGCQVVKEVSNDEEGYSKSKEGKQRNQVD